MPDGTRTVAAFDLDGTLTRRDTLLPFLAALCGRVALAKAVIAVSGVLATTMLVDDNARRGEVKDQLLVKLIAGRPIAEVQLIAQRYAHAIVGSNRLRPSIYEHWEHHLDAGHELVIVSASLEVYVNPLARILGGTAGLGTRLEVGADQRLTGHIDGANCRGDQKVRRLDRWLAETGGDTNVEVFAYGDSSGDDALLGRADHPTKVSRR